MHVSFAEGTITVAKNSKDIIRMISFHCAETMQKIRQTKIQITGNFLSRWISRFISKTSLMLNKKKRTKWLSKGIKRIIPINEYPPESFY